MHDRIRRRPVSSPRAHKPVASALVTGLISLISVSATPAYAQSAQWVWTLYADASPVVLAHEIPDTPQLKTTLECDPGSGRVRLSLYNNPDLDSGPVTYRSGNASGAGEALSQRGRFSTTLPAGHPVFVTFLANGELQLARDDTVQTITIETAHLSKLRRFARACAA